MLGNQQLNHDLNPLEYDIFAGLDVDKTSMAVTFSERQQLIRSLRIPAQAECLLGYVRHRFPRQKIAFAYEAGPTGYGLYDRLTAAGYPCLVVAPSMVPTAPGQHVKTNRLDSQKLVMGLRGGQLRSIRVPSLPYRHLRHLTQLRDASVRQAIAAQCRIKALLLFEGIPFPGIGTWSTQTLLELQGLATAPAVRFKLDRLLEQLRFARGQVLQATREIRRFCMEDPELRRCIEYLMTIPGIGQITASQLLARIGDWRRLRHVREMAAFLGLVAREHSTGEQIRRGSITHAGDARLRSKLIQCAWAAVRCDPELREFYGRIHQRHPLNQAARKAIVAVARKMTTRIYAVLHEQRPYRIQHGRVGTQEETWRPRERLDRPKNQAVGCFA
jgi:transposase